MKFCIAGKNSIAVHGLKLAMSRLGADNIIVCANRTDDGKSGWQPSLRRYANEFAVPVVSLDVVQQQEDLLFLSLEFDQLLKPAEFKSKKLFNMHFSLLPAYKGMYTSAWPILNGERQSGVTIHRIDHGIDTGSVIAQDSFDLADDETARSLYRKYLSLGSKLLDRTFESLYNNTFTETDQLATGSTYFSRESIKYSTLSIDLNQTALGIDRQIRAYAFTEYQQPVVHGMAIASCQILGIRSEKKPGHLLSQDDNSVCISTVDFDIRLFRDASLDILAATRTGELQDDIYLKGLSTVGINTIGTDGWSSLMIAAFNGEIHTCARLIALGADVNLTNCNGTTPLMYAKDFAESSGDFSICELLLHHGATICLKDGFGKDLLHYCGNAGQTRSIKFFSHYAAIQRDVTKC